MGRRVGGDNDLKGGEKHYRIRTCSTAVGPKCSHAEVTGERFAKSLGAIRNPPKVLEEPKELKEPK